MTYRCADHSSYLYRLQKGREASLELGITKKEIINKTMEKITQQEAQNIGNTLTIPWNEISLEEFTMGVNVEMEHGTRYPETNVTGNDPLLTGKIAWAHLKEFPDYYTRLLKLEGEADAFWKNKE
jgi:hypothetical protein